MNHLSVMDAILDQGVCELRDFSKEFGEEQIKEIENELHKLTDSDPRFCYVACAYHLGRLLLLRADCELEMMEMQDGGYIG